MKKTKLSNVCEVTKQTPNDNNVSKVLVGDMETVVGVQTVYLGNK